MKLLILAIAIAFTSGCASRRYTVTDSVTSTETGGAVVLTTNRVTEVRSNTLLTGSRISELNVSKTGLRVGSAEQIGDAAMVNAIAAGVAAGMKSSMVP